MSRPSALPFPERRRPVALPPDLGAAAPAKVVALPRSAVVDVPVSGEAAVVEQLARLPRGWRYGHRRVGDDRRLVVTGPTGLYLLLVVDSPDSRVCVYRHAVYVDGCAEPLIPTARNSGHLLSVDSTAPHERPVEVQVVIVFVGLDELDIQAHPHRPVHVVESHRLADWLVARRS